MKAPNRLKISRPAKRLKPFFWNKLSNNILESTVWSGLPFSVDFDLSDLEATFVIDNTTPTMPNSKISVGSQVKKGNVTTLLDITRANNVGK